jgi:hypothetical protein
VPYTSGSWTMNTNLGGTGIVNPEYITFHLPMSSTWTITNPTTDVNGWKQTNLIMNPNLASLNYWISTGGTKHYFDVNTPVKYKIVYDY